MEVGGGRRKRVKAPEMFVINNGGMKEPVWFYHHVLSAVCSTKGAVGLLLSRYS